MTRLRELVDGWYEVLLLAATVLILGALMDAGDRFGFALGLLVGLPWAFVIWMSWERRQEP